MSSLNLCCTSPGLHKWYSSFLQMSTTPPSSKRPDIRLPLLSRPTIRLIFSFRINLQKRDLFFFEIFQVAYIMITLMLPTSTEIEIVCSMLTEMYCTELSSSFEIYFQNLVGPILDQICSLFL